MARSCGTLLERPSQQLVYLHFVKQLATMMIMTITGSTNIIALPSNIHCVIPTHLKIIVLLALMSDCATVHGALIVSCDATDYHTIRLGLTTIINLATGENGKLQVRLLSVTEIKMLIVIVGMGVFVFA